MAFAYDLILLSESDAGMKIIEQEVESFFAAKGMRINPVKSAAISLKKDDKGKKLFYRVWPYFCVGNVMIPQFTVENFTTYLGIKFTRLGRTDVSEKEFADDLTND